MSSDSPPGSGGSAAVLGNGDTKVAPPGVTSAQAASQTQAGHGDDWAAQLTHKVDGLVSILRDRTVKPVSKAVRYLIFGLLAFSLGSLALVLLSVFALRVLDNEVPAFRGRVWASYFVLGGIFGLGTLLLSRVRRAGK
jgi:hypothetical protein